jgi:NAD(P)H-dependent FMN reductase
MEDIQIAVIIGTTRAQRQSDKAARFVAAYLEQQPHVTVTLVDPNDFTLPGDGNDPEGQDPRYSAIVEQSDAFFIIVPEYNHSFPGSLKRLLDSELALYNHKPVAFAGTSSGGWGGVRGVEALVSAVRELGLISLSWDMYFPRVQDLFDEQGILLANLQVSYTKQLEKLSVELFWLARLLKAARNRETV